ncbi:MAG: hypothetical protein KAR13_04525, partial [Desulfobulbaceae bacterium]|nr:hypothetical protein [Desulfobulbaceae bacterium]
TISSPCRTSTFNPFMNTIAIIQARSASKRLPDKVLKPFCNGFTLLDYCLHNLSQIQAIAAIFVATTNKPEDNRIVEHCQDRAHIYRGSEYDVMGRFVDIANLVKPESIIRICSDNPFVLREGVEYLISRHSPYDYTSFMVDKTPAMLIPSGLFAECISAAALKKLYLDANDLEKEHVTYGLYKRDNNVFTCNFIDAGKFNKKTSSTNLRLTVDTENDFNLINSMISALNLGLNIDLEIFHKILDFVYKNDFIKEMISENSKQQNAKAYEG